MVLMEWFKRLWWELAFKACTKNPVILPAKRVCERANLPGPWYCFSLFFYTNSAVFLAWHVLVLLALQFLVLPLACQISSNTFHHTNTMKAKCNFIQKATQLNPNILVVFADTVKRDLHPYLSLFAGKSKDHFSQIWCKKSDDSLRQILKKVALF